MKCPYCGNKLLSKPELPGGWVCSAGTTDKGRASFQHHCAEATRVLAEYGCYAKIGIVSCSAGWCKEHAVEAGLDFKTKPVKESGISLCSCDWNMVLREGCQCGGR
jgi:hypothetical protein